MIRALFISVGVVVGFVVMGVRVVSVCLLFIVRVNLFGSLLFLTECVYGIDVWCLFSFPSYSAFWILGSLTSLLLVFVVLISEVIHCGNHIMFNF